MSSQLVLFPVLLIVGIFYVVGWILVTTCVVTFFTLHGTFRLVARMFG